VRRGSSFLLSLIIFCLVIVQTGQVANSAASTAHGSIPAQSTQRANKLQGQSSFAGDESRPEISFEQITYDFGEVGPGTKNFCKFNFKNTGGGVLKIQKVVPTCSCTAASVSKNDYAPGESGFVRVEYTTDKRLGEDLQGLNVYSNDEENPTIELTVKATIILKVRCEPDSLRLYPVRENAGCGQLRVKSIDNRPFAITGFKSWPNCISAEFDPLLEATEFVLSPKVDTEKLPADSSGRVEISVSHPQTTLVTVSFNVHSNYKVSPAKINLINVEAQMPVIKNIWVFSEDGGDFQIESFRAQNNTTKVLKQQKTDRGYKLELRITPPAKAGGQTAFSDTLIISIEGGEELKCKLKGYYVKGLKKSK